MARELTPSDAGVEVGEVLEGKYRVDAILGHGGMGVVVECTHLALNTRYALKLLRQDVLADHDAVQRFIREAQAAVKLKSEYVAHVSDVGTFENGVPYMVMEFLEGHDIGELLDERGTLPVAWATELVLQTAEALCEAHSLGIVHRDVKPTNLFVTWRPDGSALVKVLDFGISKSPVGSDMKLTQTQSVLGTPAYMSPEQMRSAHMVDSRSDIWSLGTVLYEMIEGHRPFEAENFSEMCVKVSMDEPLPMKTAPPALQTVIARCLAKQPQLRYATMAELGRALVPFAPNAQQAKHLADRMERMLRRSPLGWDSESTSSQPTISSSLAVPQLTAELTSEQASAPRRPIWPWLVGIAAFGAAGAGLALSLSGAAAPMPLPAAFVAAGTPPAPSPRVPAPVPVPVAQPPPVSPIAVANPPMRKPSIRHAGGAPKPAIEATVPPPPPPQGSAAPPCDPFRVEHGQCPK